MTIIAEPKLERREVALELGTSHLVDRPRRWTAALLIRSGCSKSAKAR
ncbi:hypothetical protein [Novosphingobium sp. HII-3]|nr:hypothetical protein [Novosphingobium sp. HII-3]